MEKSSLRSFSRYNPSALSDSQLLENAAEKMYDQFPVSMIREGYLGAINMLFCKASLGTAPISFDESFSEGLLEHDLLLWR